MIVPPHEKIIEMAKNIPNQQIRAFFILAYLTGGRINELLPKRFIQRQKKDDKTKITTKWREELNYSGITKKDITFEITGEKEYMVVTMLNEKNKDQHKKVIPIRIEKEGELIILFREYLDKLTEEQVLFPISDVTALLKLRKWSGINPHSLRHFRTTHYITYYHIKEAEVLRRLLGWSDLRPLKIYSHLMWTDLAERL